MKKLSKITENLWADLQDRSSGEVIRKEDDVNLMDMDGLCDYIKNRYEDKIDSVRTFGSSGVDIDIQCIIGDKCFSTLSKAYMGRPGINKILIYLKKTDNNFLKKVYKRFDAGEEQNTYNIQSLAIREKDRTCTNQTFVDLIDLTLQEEPIKENLWADLQGRSSGEVTRKEDIIKTREELDEIIWSAYEEQGKGDTLTIDLTGKKILVDDLSYLFSIYKNVKHIFGLETWDVSNMKDMENMFDDCQNLTELDLSNWDVSNVTNMTSMFNGCLKLTTLNISTWDVSNVKDMRWMFQGCKNLKELDLNNWNVGNVVNMDYMFLRCPIQYTKKGNKLIRK